MARLTKANAVVLESAPARQWLWTQSRPDNLELTVSHVIPCMVNYLIRNDLLQQTDTTQSQRALWIGDLAILCTFSVLVQRRRHKQPCNAWRSRYHETTAELPRQSQPWSVPLIQVDWLQSTCQGFVPCFAYTGHKIIPWYSRDLLDFPTISTLISRHRSYRSGSKDDMGGGDRCKKSG